MLRLVATILFASAALCPAAESAAGRWEGVAQIPGNELRLIVDLSDEGGKGWTGSIIIPGFSIKGAELVDLHVRGGDLEFVLSKTGPPQVDLPPRSTAVAKEVEGEWKGDYEMMGYARHATLKFANRGIEGAALEFTIVGKRVNNVPVSLVMQDGDFLTVKSDEFGITFEGRFSKEAGEIKGTLSQGPMEAPLVLRKTP